MSLSVREDSLRLEGLNRVSLAAFPVSPVYGISLLEIYVIGVCISRVSCSDVFNSLFINYNVNLDRPIALGGLVSQNCSVSTIAGRNEPVRLHKRDVQNASGTRV
jgi:hypothetical protein